MNALYVGIDFGTSGCRAAAIDQGGRTASQFAVAMPPPDRDGAAIEQHPHIWWTALQQALCGLLDDLDRDAVRSLAVDGTSGTLLLTDGGAAPLGPALMYNDARAEGEAAEIGTVAPAESGALGASSALAKLLHLQKSEPASGARHALHQADWIAGRLSGKLGISDHNNALKLGYDVIADRWPDWFGALGVQRRLLPKVLAPGTLIGPIAPEQADAFGLPAETAVVAGTTDGVAAFLATGASVLGDGVTSLGSTLVVKQLADRPLFDPASGVYSHRLGDLWLLGGASNSGDAALAQFFDADAIARLTPTLRPELPTGLDYYPLPATGERFPINDPEKPSVTKPRPEDDATFLQALFEGIAAIEALAYQRLKVLGGPPLRSIRTVGGGAGNPAWTDIRRNRLRVEITKSATTEAAFGAARLARTPFTDEGQDGA